MARAAFVLEYRMISRILFSSAVILLTSGAVLQAAEPVASKSQTKAKSVAGVKFAAALRDEKITQEEVLEQMQRDLGERILQLRSANPTQFAQYYKLYRDQMVGMKLLAAEAQRREKEIITDPKIKAQFDQMRKTFLVNAFVSWYIEGRIKEETLKGAYDAQKKPQEMIQLSRIVVGNEKKAKSLVLALKTQPFDQLAKKHSTDPTNIDLPVVLSARLPERLRAHVASLKKGGTSVQPLDEGNGKWSIWMLKDRRSASFEESKPVLRDAAAMKELQTLMAQLSQEQSAQLYDLEGNPTKDSLLSIPPGGNALATGSASGSLK